MSRHTIPKSVVPLPILFPSMSPPASQTERARLCTLIKDNNYILGLIWLIFYFPKGETCVEARLSCLEISTHAHLQPPERLIADFGIIYK